MSLNFKRTVISALLISLSIPALIAHAAIVPPGIQEQQRKILKNRREIEVLLNTKAHILTKEIVAQAEGSLEGSIVGDATGSMSARSPMAGMMKGVSLGVMGGASVGAMAAMLGGPLGLASALGSGILGGALIGGGAGALAGAAHGAEVATGQLNASLKGSIKGSYKSEEWINHYKPQIYVLTVINPEQLTMVKELIGRIDRHNKQFPKQRPMRIDFLTGYSKLVETFYQSKSFFTPSEVQSLIAKISVLNEDLYNLTDAALSLTTEQQATVSAFVGRIEESMKQKLVFNQIGLEGFDVRVHSAEFVNIYGEGSFAGIKVARGTSAEQLSKWIVIQLKEYFDHTGDLVETKQGTKLLKGESILVSVEGQYPHYQAFLRAGQKSYELITRTDSPTQIQVDFVNSQSSESINGVSLDMLSEKDVTRMQVVREDLMPAILSSQNIILPNKDVTVYTTLQK